MIKQTTVQSGVIIDHCPEIKPFTFIKKDDIWFIDHSERNELGIKADCEAIAGADDILDMLARNKKRVTITMDTLPFDRADELELIELCDAPKGGGYYLVRTFRGREINRKIWLCDSTLLLLGEMPERLYVRREAGIISQ
jgi:hypothetical protein